MACIGVCRVKVSFLNVFHKAIMLPAGIYLLGHGWVAEASGLIRQEAAQHVIQYTLLQP